MSNMGKRILPKRPQGDNTSLSEIEKDALSYYVLFEPPKEFVFARFLHPEMQMSKTALKRATEMFFDDKDSKEYIEEYRRTIENFLNFSSESKEMDDEEKHKVQMNAINKAKEFIIKELQDIENNKDPETVLKLADKLNMLNLEEVYEQPRRYLPESCNDCRYKQWIEENCVETKE